MVVVSSLITNGPTLGASKGFCFSSAPWVAPLKHFTPPQPQTPSFSPLALALALAPANAAGPGERPPWPDLAVGGSGDADSGTRGRRCILGRDNHSHLFTQDAHSASRHISSREPGQNYGLGILPAHSVVAAAIGTEPPYEIRGYCYFGQSQCSAGSRQCMSALTSIQGILKAHKIVGNTGTDRIPGYWFAAGLR